MEIKKVTETDKDDFNKASVHPLQSWEWGEFRAKAGNKVVRLGVYSGSNLTDAIQVVFSRIPKTKFKIGTVIKGPKPTKDILKTLRGLAEEENAVFIKLEPNVPTSVNNQPQTLNRKENLFKLLKEYGAVKGKTLFTPSTFWIDLTPTEEQLLRSFHPKTRYNIRVAERHGVKVIEDNSDKAFEKYIDLTRETVERQRFYSHTEKYHRLMWQHLNKDMVSEKDLPIARLLTAVYQNEIITTWIVFAWHEFLYYPYGASTEKFKNVMANNLMLWEAIRYGKEKGLKTFDLWGREEGKGFTKFKEGYNPKVVEFLGTWDLITNPIYQPYKIAEKIRWNILRSKAKFIKPTF